MKMKREIIKSGKFANKQNSKVRIVQVIVKPSRKNKKENTTHG